MATVSTIPLRFGAVIRVSTETQEKQGESLRTQRENNQRNVDELNGKIVEWYGGQEHATPGHETKEIDRLLFDAQQGKLDAMIVAHQDRWSRDNAKSKAGLEILRQNKVRFFVGKQEYDLFNPTAKFFLGVSAEIGELTAGTQNQKSIENRIARAKRGIPTAGKLPFGRTFDRKTGEWGIVAEKKELIVSAAERYLAGESATSLAKEFQMNQSYLLQIFRERCGSTWTETFDYPAFNIHEVISHKVPRLLPQSTIREIAKVAKTRKVYSKSGTDRNYLLSGKIFCEGCDYVLSGNTNVKTTSRSEKSYYRHSRHTLHECESPKGFIDAAVIERVVLRELFQTFGNVKAVERAIKAAIPNNSEVIELRKRQARIDEASEKTVKAIAKVQQGWEDGDYSKTEFRSRLAVLREREGEQESQKAKLERQLAHLPSDDSIASYSKEVVEQLQAAIFPTGRWQRKLGGYRGKGADISPKLALNISRLDHPADDLDAIDEMTYEDSRALIEAVFQGESADGKQAGVYIRWTQRDNENRPRWSFRIRGIIEPGKMAVRLGKKHRTVNALHSRPAAHRP